MTLLSTYDNHVIAMSAIALSNELQELKMKRHQDPFFYSSLIAIAERRLASKPNFSVAMSV